MVSRIETKVGIRAYNFRGKKPTPYGGLLPVVGRALI